MTTKPTHATDQARWFAEQVQPHEPALRAFLHARFPALTETDDLVQESYVRLLRAHTARRITNVRSFLFTTARNLALDLFRRNRVVVLERVDDFERLSVSEGGPDALERLCHDQELALLHEAVASLPARCREVLSLRKVHGLSREEIARRLNISPATVNAQIATGMLRCRKYFQERGLLAEHGHE